MKYFRPRFFVLISVLILCRISTHAVFADTAAKPASDSAAAFHSLAFQSPRADTGTAASADDGVNTYNPLPLNYWHQLDWHLL